MRCAAKQDGHVEPEATPPAGLAHAPSLAARRRWIRAAGALTVVVLAGQTLPALAADTQLSSFELVHNDDGLFLSYAIDLELSHSVDDALGKAVPLFFVAEAEIYRSRFYWRDQRVGYAVRRWRIVFQPLTSTYRVTFDGGISQNYATRGEALGAISRAVQWKIAEGPQIQEGSRYYVEFNFRLDTSQLPRPMQIGIGGQADWNLSVQRSQKID